MSVLGDIISKIFSHASAAPAAPAATSAAAPAGSQVQVSHPARPAACSRVQMSQQAQLTEPPKSD